MRFTSRESICLSNADACAPRPLKRMALAQVLLTCVLLVLLAAFYATRNGWFMAGLGLGVLVLIALFFISLPGTKKPGEEIRY